MSLGGNLSSGYTAILNEKTIQSGISKVVSIANSDPCSRCPGTILQQPVAAYSSMLLASKVCPQPSSSDFALYPKVAVPSSVRTQMLTSPTCQNNVNRFSQYTRYQVPVPCQPLPQSASMAGISKPTTLNCNIYPHTGK